MSSHHSQQFFNLHHQQQAGARSRRVTRQEDRLQRFIDGRNAIQAEARQTFLIASAFAFLCFAYIAFAVPAYTVYIFGHIAPGWF